MYENQTFENILQRMLDRVPNIVDKREGSIIYDALAPAAMELAACYFELDSNISLSYADTASGEFLTRKASEFGVNRKQAVKAVRKGVFYSDGGNHLDIPVGSLFAIEGITYEAVERISSGQYKLECQTPGSVGNRLYGTLLPVDYVEGLARAELEDIILAGSDDEADEDLRQRFYIAANEKPFGGNVADYKKKLHERNGVGGVKVFPTWQGGGTVKCTVQGSDYKRPSDVFITELQNEFDPTPQGKGLGLAPIGHTVTIASVQDGYIYVEVTLQLKDGITGPQIQPDVEAAVESYFNELRKSWERESEIVVRIAQIDARILGVSGVKDILDTQMIYNGQSGIRSNVTLGSEEIPILTKVGVIV